MELTNRKLVKQINIKQSIQNIWKKWTSHEGLLTFFGEDNKVQLEIGGDFEIYFLMELEPGLRGSEGCKVVSFVENQQFVFTWNAPPSLPEARNSDHHTWVVVDLEEMDDSTQITLSHVGWPKGSDWDQMYEYFDAAWERVLTALDESFES